MNSKRAIAVCVATASILAGIVSCQHGSGLSAAPGFSPALQEGGYEGFLARTKRYPAAMDIYRNRALLQKATAHSPIFICLSQQRGRLYVDGQVAADWPVSTGVDTRETPLGTFSVQFKEKEHASSRYGKIVDAEGRCVNAGADIFKDKVPVGGKFIGAPMPNWMRLTGNGIGLHTGKVRAGRQLSHGCVRIPHAMATELFDIARVGTRVTITQGLEPSYPQTAAAILAGKRPS